MYILSIHLSSDSDGDSDTMLCTESDEFCQFLVVFKPSKLNREPPGEPASCRGSTVGALWVLRARPALPVSPARMAGAGHGCNWGGAYTDACALLKPKSLRIDICRFGLWALRRSSALP